MTRYLRTEMVPLDQLTPFPGNARRGRVDVIKESIVKNGQYRSLIIREIKDGPLVVLAGNHTMIAIDELGGAQARCEIIECDEDTARRINIVDNRSSDLAEDDEEALAAILSGLDDYSGIGYDEEEVDSILAKYEEAETTEYREPEVAEYNDDIGEREERIREQGDPESRTMESRGVRDVILALPVEQADELGRLITKLRESWGQLSQGETVLRATRVAFAALQCEDDCAAAAEEPYTRAPEPSE
jgi:ParB-like chromosome segregation protein Spo0J